MASDDVPRMRTPSRSSARASRRRSLTAELDHHPDRLLHRDDLEHVLQREGLEVEGVGDIEIGGDSLGIGVHHHGPVAQLPKGHGRPHAAVVELDTLPDPVGATSQDQHGLIPARLRLVLLVVGGVEVGSGGGKLAGTGVHGLIGRPNPEPMALGANRRLGRRPGDRPAGGRRSRAASF